MTATVSQQDIEQALRKVIDPADRIIVLHPNVFAFGKFDNPVEELARAVLNVLAPQQTLVLPAFTFSFCRTGVYHTANTPADTGVLIEHFRLHEQGFRRSRCPINSFLVKGPMSDQLLSLGDAATCWGEDSLYRALYDHNALIVGLGEPLSIKGSIFHYAEQKAQVPYRYFKTFKGRADYGDGLRDVSTQMYVRRLDVPVVYDFSPAVDELKKRSLFKHVPAGRSFVESFHARDAVDALVAIARKDPLSLLTSRAQYEELNARRSFAVLGSANLDYAVKDLERQHEFWLGQKCRTIAVPFGQYRQQIFDPASNLNAADPDYVVLVERLEDVLAAELQGALRGNALKDSVDQKVRDYAACIRQARERLSGAFLVADFEHIVPSVFGSSDNAAPEGATAIAQWANACLRQELNGLADVHILDFKNVVHEVGAGKAFDPKFWYMAKVPFHRDFAEKLCRDILGKVLALEGKTIRLVVADLDNTLWAGVIGDDGIAGIQLGGDYPGNVYKDIQYFLKSLAGRGIALAISSKNNEDAALEVLRNHPDMVLKEKDFAARQINWDDKAASIQKICGALSLGLSSVMFLDDNPVERQMVRQALPACIVPELPVDIMQWRGFLSTHPYLQFIKLTDEDMKRSSQYAQRARAEEHKQQFSNVDDFLKSLQMEIEIEPYGPSNAARIKQLIAKTNQFNATTRRHQDKDLDVILKQGGEIFGIHFKDKFYAQEIIGVVIAIPEGGTCVIDTFLLSCRVLGRKIETAVLSWLTRYAAERKMDRVRGLIVETPPNQPVRDVYLQHGFLPTGAGTFVLDVGAGHRVTMPDCFNACYQGSVRRG